MNSTGRVTKVPRVVGPIRRVHDVEARDAAFLVANASHATKITLPGPFTLSRQVRDEFYKDEEALAMAYAEAVNIELKALKTTGVDVLQLDEPWVRTAPEAAKRYGIKAINRALEGVEGPTIVHVCFGYAAVVSERSRAATRSWRNSAARRRIRSRSRRRSRRLDLGVLRDLAGKTIMLGVLDLGDAAVETAEVVADRIRAGLRYVPAEKLVPAPDCGMKYLPAASAFGKLKALADGRCDRPARTGWLTGEMLHSFAQVLFVSGGRRKELTRRFSARCTLIRTQIAFQPSACISVNRLASAC